MSISWEEHHRMEVAEEYPAAVDALEERLKENPDDVEAIVRLGFNLWNVAAEWDRVGVDAGLAEQYAVRFMQLYLHYKDRFLDNADFCWSFGLGMHLFWYHFPDASEDLGNSLMQHAGEIEPFYQRLNEHGGACPTQEEFAERFHGRGILADYYAVA